MTRPAARPARPLVLRRPPDHRQGAAAGLGAQLPRHRPPAPGLRRRGPARQITRLELGDLTFDRVLGFLRHLGGERGNHIRTRNQRLAALHTLFEYIAGRVPEMLDVCQQVAAIPMKRVAPPETRFLERDEIDALFRRLPREGRHALRDRALLALPVQHRRTGRRRPPICGSGTSISASIPASGSTARATSGATCPLWGQTAELLRSLLRSRGPVTPETAGVLGAGHPLTRFGIYKIVRRHAARFDDPRTGRRISPHIFRHTAAVHLLEAGVEVNVIRGWLGHADLDDHQPLRRDQHAGQRGGAPRARASEYCGGVPHQANLALRRIAPEMARLALIVMWPAVTGPWAAPRCAPARRGPPAT